jgi:hypothetical protein
MTRSSLPSIVAPAAAAAILPGATYDHQPERQFDFVPLWGLLVSCCMLGAAGDCGMRDHVEASPGPRQARHRSKKRRNQLAEYSSMAIQVGVKVGKATATRAPRRRPDPEDPEQLVLWKPRGGKRRGAGRKPKGRRSGSPHKPRPELKARIRSTWSCGSVGAVGNLRRRFTYRAIDRFSSAVTFPGWAEYGEHAFLWRGPWDL